MSTKRRSIWCKVLVYLLASFGISTDLQALDLHEQTENIICKIICEMGDSKPVNCSCKTLASEFLNNTQKLAQSLLCKSDNTFFFKLLEVLEDGQSYYVLERRENHTNWQYVNYGKIPHTRIVSVSGLKSNTSYKIRTWIIQNRVYTPIETGWLKTAASNVIPLPVVNMTSNYFFTGNNSYATVEWLPAEDLSCYYFFAYHSHNESDYFYINKVETLFKLTIKNIAYNCTYNLSLRACNSKFSLESRPKEIVMMTPSCLSVHNNLSVCAPAKPENLKVVETPNLVNFSYYDLKVSWSVPEYIPEYYNIWFESLAENGSKEFNISGESSNITINNVKVQDLYYVRARAWSSAGVSESAIYPGHVKIEAYKSSNIPIAWISIGLFLLICCCTAISVLINYALAHKRRMRKENDCLKRDLEQKCPSSLTVKDYQQEMLDHLEDEWVINPKNLMLQKILGEGAFGVVKYGLLTKGKAEIVVAAKTLRSSPTREELGHFQHELETLKSVGSHPHLVSLIGVCEMSVCGPVIVVEYCSKGDLQSYLKDIWENIINASAVETMQNKNAREFANKMYDREPINLCNNELINSKQLLSFARQISKGMEYLSTLKILHRDLAARNVLICEDMTIKISDFGLSRDVYRDNVYYKTAAGRLPIRWMAIECLTHQQYTTQSDVWSFGILLWEITTLGGNPYPEIQTENLLKLLKVGYRMECPINCKRELYNIMLNCWKANPKDRPTFTEIRKEIETLLESETEYLQIDLNISVEMNTFQCNRYKNLENRKTIFQRYVKPIWS